MLPFKPVFSRNPNPSDATRREKRTFQQNPVSPGGVNPAWANRTVGHQTRYWPIAAPQGAPISGFRVWAAQERYAGQYWRWGVPWGAPSVLPRRPLGPNSPISAPGLYGGNVWVDKTLSVLHLFDAQFSQLPRVPGTQVARALSIDLGH